MNTVDVKVIEKTLEGVLAFNEIYKGSVLRNVRRREEQHCCHACIDLHGIFERLQELTAWTKHSQ